MKLLKLCLENFQGTKNFSIDFNGKSMNIYGSNATGKTTIFNAFTWLFFNKSSTGTTNFSPKTKGADGHDIHFLTNKATATVQLDNGQIKTFSKALKEDWRKKRGSNIEEFSGNTTEYHIDGVPISQGEFDKAIGNICKPDHLKILTKATYFSEEMHWQERRTILLGVCGDITDREIINSNEELAMLNTVLLKPGTDQLYCIEDYLKIANSERKKINQELDGIPNRVDEAQKAIPELNGFDIESIERAISKLEDDISILEQQKAGVNSSTAALELQKQLSSLFVELEKAKAMHLDAENKQKEISNSALNQLRSQHINLVNDLQQAEINLQNKKQHLQKVEEIRQQEYERYKQELAVEWQGSVECYACGQSLPSGKIEASKAAFNLKKSKTLEQIKDYMKQKCSKDIIKDLKNVVEQFEVLISNLKTQVEEAKSRLAQEQQLAMSNAVAPFESTPIFVQLNQKINDVRNKIQDGSINISDAKNAIQLQIDHLQVQLRKQMEIRGLFKTAAIQNERIEHLKAREKELSKMYEQLQRNIYLCEVFTKTKASLLNAKINSRFKTVSFRLFNEQINGAVKEDCEVLIPCTEGLIPYTFANNAAKINAGIEIINVLSRHWGAYMPTFIDNRESVVNLVESDTQIISLIVSEHDNVIRTEVL